MPVSTPLPIAYTAGTQRLVHPRATLARIAPLLARCGITRLTCVTGLDRLGVPVYCAIRPAGRVVQVSNGKGLDVDSARVSALMEAIELHHAENPLPAHLRLASADELAGDGATVLLPPALPGADGRYYAPTFRHEWLRGEALDDGAPVWAPASLACFARTPAPLVTDTNGLASGNHVLEASLHALYELLERDALAQLSDAGRLRIRERCRVIDAASIPDPLLRETVARIERNDSRVVLMWLPSRIAVHTFWTVLLNRRRGAAVSTLNLGAGCHHDPTVAAARAVTEAAQARLTFIHGAREDRGRKPVDTAPAVEESPAYRYFERLPASAAWRDLPASLAPGGGDLRVVHDWVVSALGDAGQRAWRFDLTHADIGITVVKVVAPGLACNQRLL